MFILLWLLIDVLIIAFYNPDSIDSSVEAFFFIVVLFPVIIIASLYLLGMFILEHFFKENV